MVLFGIFLLNFPFKTRQECILYTCKGRIVNRKGTANCDPDQSFAWHLLHWFRAYGPKTVAGRPLYAFCCCAWVYP